MRFKKEYVILGVIILALGTYLLLNQRDRIHYDLPETADLDATTITKIEITKEGDTVSLTRQDDQWRLTPGDYPADKAQVERMLKSVAELTVTALVSETQSYARYDLDADRRIEVKAYEGDQLVRRFMVGKAASTFRHTHVLLGEDKNVYHAAGSFRWEFDKPVDDLRDKKVLDFERGMITEITIETGDKQLVIAKQEPPPARAEPAEDKSDNEAAQAPAPADRWLTAEGQAVDAAEVEQFLSAFAPLKCSTFLDTDQKKTLTDPQYRLQLKGAETAKTLDLFSPSAEAESDYAGLSSDSPYPFKLAEFEVTKIKDFYTAITGPEKSTESPDETPEPVQN
jgi:hypothetical protein